DVPLLAEHFLERFSKQMGKAVSKISAEAMQHLVRYAWPGNVRELENVVERAVALETTPAVLVERLPGALLVDGGGTSASASHIGEGFSLDDHLHAIEADLVRRALQQAEGERATASRLLGITARSLRYLIRKHNLDADKN